MPLKRWQTERLLNVQQPGVSVLAAPGDYRRIWLGMHPTQSGNNVTLSSKFMTSTGQGALCQMGALPWPLILMTRETHPWLIHQEWWVQMQLAGNALAIIEVFEDDTAPPAKMDQGLLLPSANGRTVDDLSGYDPAKMDTLLQEMRRQTRRLQRV